MKRSAAIILLSLLCAAGGPADSDGLFFTYLLGLSGPRMVDDARWLGLNTIYLTIDPEQVDRLGPIKVAVRNAHQAGLQSIVALPTSVDSELGLSTGDQSYVDRVRTLLRETVGELASEEGITAWATSDFLEGDIRYSAAGFQQYLKTIYRDLATLNAAWGTEYLTWSQIGIVGALSADDEMPFAVGRPSIDFADFQRQEFHDLMALWADVIREADPTRPLMTGRISLYRSLSAIPDDYDIIQVWMPPDILEPDTTASNVHALHMGRRMGKFRVLPVLRLPVPPSPLFSENALGRWIGVAALGGACGFGIEDAERIEENRSPAEVRSQLHDTLAAVQPTDFGIEPAGTIAILWEPYAQGFAAGQEKVPAYGFIQGLSDGEPNNLFGAFRLGTVFGGVDILQLNEVADVDLDRYGVIFGPLALKLTPEAVTAIEGYIERGGVFVCDLGAGMYNSGQWDKLPHPLGAWCGVEGIVSIKDRVGNLKVNCIPPLFPSLRPGMDTKGFTEMGKRGGTSVAGGQWTVVGPAAHALIAEDTIPLAVLDVERDEEGSPAWAGILVRTRGLGATVFATYPLWSNWSVNDPSYIAFHRDLCSRRAMYQLIGPPLFPDQVHIAGLGGDEFRLYNSGSDTIAEVLSYTAKHRAYLGAIAKFSAGSRYDNGLRTGYARLTVPLGSGELRTLRAIPLLVQPYAGEVTAIVEQYDENAIVLQLAGTDTRLQTSRDGRLTLSSGKRTQTRLAIRNGDYEVTPGSRHQVTFQWPDGSREEKTFEAPSSRLRFDVQARAVTLTIAPSP